MWWMLEIGIYTALALGFGSLPLLLNRRHTDVDRNRRLLQLLALLTAILTVALGSLASLTGDAWWLFAWRRTAQYGLAILGLVTAEYTRAFALRPQRWSWRTLVATVLLGAALALDLAPARLPAVLTWLEPTAPTRLVLLVTWLGMMGSAGWTAGLALRRAGGAQQSNRIRYLLVALSWLTLGDLAILGATTEPALWMRAGGVLSGLAAHLVGLAILTFAALRHRLPDIRVLALRAARLAIITGLVLAILIFSTILLTMATGTWADGLAQARRLAPALLVGSLLVSLAAPRLRQLLERTLLGRDDNLQKALGDYGRKMGLILDVGRLADYTLSWIEDSLHVEQSAFILLTPETADQTQLKIVTTRSIEALPPASFAADGRFLGHFQNTGRPLSQYDLDLLAWFREVASEERAWLHKLGLDLYVPVLFGGQPVALLALGPKRGKRPYTDQDLETLLILAGQAGAAMDNARLVDDLRHVQDDLQNLGSQLRETNLQLQRLNQAKSDFVAIAAHELRTPLSQIYGYSDVLTSMKAQELNGEQSLHQFVDGISRGAMRLKRVVDELIDMSLIETGSLALQTVQLPIPLLVKNAVDSVQPTAEPRQVRLIVQDLSTLPYIQGDSVRLEQALTSLLSNAVKFTPDGGQVQVSGRVVAPAPGQQIVEIQIADTGIGIDPAQLELIFDKFYRGENILLHSSSDTRFKGAGPGLGLAIARGIVEAHGGRIWVESPGRDESKCPGSTFYVHLPLGPIKVT